MLFRRSGSELFDTFKNIILLRIFPLWNIYSWKVLRKLKWQIPGEHLAARYNWCQDPVPGRGLGVEKHCSRKFTYLLVLTYLLHGAESFLRSLLVLQLVKKFLAFYGTRKFITTHKCPPPFPILSQLHPVLTTPSLFLKIHLNIILPSTSGSPQWYSRKFIEYNRFVVFDAV